MELAGPHPKSIIPGKGLLNTPQHSPVEPSPAPAMTHAHRSATMRFNAIQFLLQPC
jgi:hypothetical protein